MKNFKGPVESSAVMPIFVKQIGINWDVFSDQRRYISQTYDTGLESVPD